MSIETTFQKNVYFPKGKKIGLLLCYYREWETSGNSLPGSTRSFDIYCASHKIISLRPKKSIEITFQKYVYVPDEKKNANVYSRITEYGRRQATFYYVLQIFLAIIVQVVRSFLQHLEGFWKHEFLKKASVPLKKKHTGHSFLISTSWQISGNNLTGSTRLFDICFASYNTNLLGHKCSIQYK